jgi:hypothetical protein
MSSSRVVDETERSAWLDHLTVDAKVATVLGSIPEYYDRVEAEEWQMKHKVHEKNQKKFPCLHLS